MKAHASFLMLLIALLFSQTSKAADAPPPPPSTSSITPFVNEQTIGVVRVDTPQIDLDAINAWTQRAVPAAGPETKELLDSIGQVLPRGKAMLDRFRQAGGHTLFVVINLNPTPDEMVLVIAPVPAGADAKAIEQAMQAFAPGFQVRTATVGGVAVLGGPQTLAQLQHFQPSARPDVVAAIASAGDAPVAGALVPSEIARRLFEVTVPQMAAELGGGPTTLVTHGMHWTSIALKLPPDPMLRIRIQSQDAESAQRLNTVLQNLQQTLRRVADVGPTLKALADNANAPRAEGDHIVIDLQAESLRSFVHFIASGVVWARVQSARMRSANNIRQIVLACLMYANLRPDDQWPDTLDQAAQSQHVPAAALTNPSQPTRKPGYIYIKPPPLKELKHSEQRLVVYEAHGPEWNVGVNVGFADGHVEFISDEAQFKKLLAEAGKKP